MHAYTSEERADIVVAALKETYPNAVCALEWGGHTGAYSYEEMLRDSWKLLIMARLSAQCTDARVNIVCRELFNKYHSPQDVADAELHELEAIIRPCGLYHTKAESIITACRILMRDHNGVVPNDTDALLAMPGVGRKIANLLRGDIYKEPGIVADTHCIRICGRLGFYDETVKDPLKTEKIMSAVIPPREQSDFCHRIVQFGRDVCTARAPMCNICPLSSACAKYQRDGSH